MLREEYNVCLPFHFRMCSYAVHCYYVGFEHYTNKILEVIMSRVCIQLKCHLNVSILKRYENIHVVTSKIDKTHSFTNTWFLIFVLFCFFLIYLSFFPKSSKCTLSKIKIAAANTLNLQTFCSFNNSSNFMKVSFFIID